MNVYWSPSKASMATVPEYQESNCPYLNKKDKALKPLKCEMWGNLIFINRDLQAPSLMEHLGQAAIELSLFDFDKHKLGINTIYDIDVFFLEPQDNPEMNEEQKSMYKKQVDDVLKEDFSNV